MGHLYYLFAPSNPYHPDELRLGKRGNADFVEFPVQVAGFFRLPFFATFHLTYPRFIGPGYEAITREKVINYQMHMSDFVDYTDQDFAGEIPDGPGSYVPLSLKTNLTKKIKVWNKVFNTLSQDFRFETLRYCLENKLQLID